MDRIPLVECVCVSSLQSKAGRGLVFLTSLLACFSLVIAATEQPTDHVGVMEGVRNIPKFYINVIIPVLKSLDNETIDFQSWQIRSTFISSFYLVSGTFVVVGFYALLLQLFTVYRISKSLRNAALPKSFKRCLKFLLAVCANDVFKLAAVYPFSFAQMMLATWPFGRLWCTFAPMIQDLTIYVSSIIMLIIMYNRHIMTRYIGDELFSGSTNENYGISLEIGLCLALFVSASAVAFYPVFIQYIGLDEYLGSRYSSFGICAANMNNDINDFLQAIFFSFFLIPFALGIHYHVRAYDVVDVWLTNANATPVNHPACRGRQERGGEVMEMMDFLRSEAIKAHNKRRDAIIAANEECRRQLMLFLMFIIQMISLIPLNAMRILKVCLPETDKNTALFDIVFLACVGFQFLPIVANPICLVLEFRAEGRTSRRHRTNPYVGVDDTVNNIIAIEYPATCTLHHAQAV